MMRHAEATRLAPMYLKVDPSVKDEFCEKATAEGLEALIPLLCGVAMKDARK
jgi:hypothetical protein